ncbi:hypothetical protein GCM10022395_01820 [Snuella lapsa]|uniref:Uncharacterized protein n=2 Tax=Snuella lapsa TaxID=870481 RepID=A0ABP6WQH3_9FLAO
MGSVASSKDFMLQQAYNTAAIPEYEKNIKVAVSIIPFSKTTHKSFLNARSRQSSNVTIHYVDSLDSKPTYVHLKLSDQISIIEALNDQINKGVKDYLSLNPDAEVITGVSMAFNEPEIKRLTTAESVFLVETEPKVYALQLINENAAPQYIKFNQGVVFAYNSSNCCWQENKKHRINIIDLVGQYDNCPNRTYRSAHRAKKRINYYKL